MKRYLTESETNKDPLLRTLANVEPVVGWIVYIGIGIYFILTWNFYVTAVTFLIYTFIISPLLVEFVLDRLMMAIYYLIRGMPKI